MRLEIEGRLGLHVLIGVAQFCGGRAKHCMKMWLGRNHKWQYCTPSIHSVEFGVGNYGGACCDCWGC